MVNHGNLQSKNKIDQIEKNINLFFSKILKPVFKEEKLKKNSLQFISRVDASAVFQERGASTGGLHRPEPDPAAAAAARESQLEENFAGGVGAEHGLQHGVLPRVSAADGDWFRLGVAAVEPTADGHRVLLQAHRPQPASNRERRTPFQTHDRRAQNSRHFGLQSMLRGIKIELEVDGFFSRGFWSRSPRF
jgi:hypothetical protein